MTNHDKVRLTFSESLRQTGVEQIGDTLVVHNLLLLKVVFLYPEIRDTTHGELSPEQCGPSIAYRAIAA